MSEVNQDDIDRLLQDAMGGGEDAAAAPDPAPAPAAPEPELEGAASQDDIDALFAAVGGGDTPPPKPAPAAPPPAPAAPPPAVPAEPEVDLAGVASQDDIDALFSSVGGADDAAPEAAPAPVPEAPAASPEPELDLAGVANQNDIDALFSATGGAAENAPEPEPASAPDPAVDAPPESEPAAVAAEIDDAMSSAEDDLDGLLASISGDGAADDAVPAAPGADDAGLDDFDMDALLREVSGAAPPPPKPAAPMQAELADTAVISPDMSAMLAQAAASDGIAAGNTAPPPPQSQPQAPPPAPTASAPAFQLPPAAATAAPSGPRREFSVLYGAGEVESVANQINALLNAMSEKAHGYMQAWIAADSEAKELRARALAEERRRTSLESEKSALGKQVDDLRSRLGEVEGGKIASEESRRTLETSFQAKIRELESQVSLLTSEAEALKDELARVRNQATGVDIESRRARFEVDRLKNEAESERMERLRIQRALENREKEIQAMQSQTTGQASSLFIDELHRLVRRLETELDIRSSGANEALRQLDRFVPSEDMVPVVANLRAALLQALGRDSDADDALKSLGREAGGVKGGLAVAPQKAELISFESALSTYNLVGAMDVASALLREATATPAALMRKTYQCPALRRPEVGDCLGDLSRLLEGLRTVQEANDRSRGTESAESEVFYVHLFDFLHNLVKLKLINRLSGDIWRLFLDLRGRFSFVTSDRQWAEYRDNTLRDKGVKP